ncbi:MAG: C-GCAxxG-C-C family protein [Oscillospiraceae bacterium]|nr:C-GCAxxG-C-C family protein [Oscillospiraceae bacterium]
MDLTQMLKLVSQGFQCAQILMIVALESEDEENSGLIRALGGLNMGLSDTCGPCGALTGGCCLISYFAGKGDEIEMEDPAYKAMLSEFTTWFKAEYGSQICTKIIEGNMKNTTERCPGIVQAAYFKAMEILHTNGVI